MNKLPTAKERLSWQRSRVFKYIRNKKLHHREQTFEDELMILLVKYAVSYDAQYIWDEHSAGPSALGFVR
jgi:hypothetical protein